MGPRHGVVTTVDANDFIMSKRYIIPSVLILSLPIIPRSLPAQQIDPATRQLLEQQLGRGVTPGDVIERIRQSGMTRSEVQLRLQQLGLDPRLADQYFDAIEAGGTGGRFQQSSDLTSTLESLGRPEAVQKGGNGGLLQGMGYATDPAALDRLMMDVLPADTLPPDALRVFGHSLFRRLTTQFNPVTFGPTDPDYRLGPGDEVVLILTGDVELVHTLTVTREGYIVIPDVGQIFVNGLTLRALESQLYDRLGRVYSGVRRGSDATTHFQVTLGRLRTNQVYVIGDVEWPAAYALSSMSTVFHALYLAGGPSDRGSFRRIQVQRGGKTIRTIDLYDYLVRGDSRSDIRLEHGDIIFVPAYRARVRLEGAVRRPAIYEILETDDLVKLLEYAGGLDAEAIVRRVQIDRILPVDQRRPGVDRVLLDVDLSQLEAGSEPVKLQDGDIIQVFAVSEERRQRVMVTGEVRRPGSYEWTDGLTLWDLIERAEGLEERAYTPRAHIYRLNERDGNRRMIQTPLLADSAGRPLQDVLIADRDSIVIYSRERLRNVETVTIDGFVKEPGTYELVEGMTVPDLILAAGGFTFGADVSAAEVARLPDERSRTDRTAEIYLVSLEDGSDPSPLAKSAPGESLPTWVPGPGEFELRHGDRIFIRKAPGFEEPRTIKITGEVMAPGAYVLERRQERLSEVIQRAGGLTTEAYAPGFQLFRDSSLVATDLQRALRQPGGRFDVILQAGDSLHLPGYDPTVLVTGAVMFESRVLYEPGKGLDYYINRAGGFDDAADPRRVTVTYQDGERAAVERKLLLFSSKPKPQPGSTIFVPEKPPAARAGFDWDRFLTRTLAVVSTTATLLIAIDRGK